MNRPQAILSVFARLTLLASLSSAQQEGPNQSTITSASNAAIGVHSLRSNPAAVSKPLTPVSQTLNPNYDEVIPAKSFYRWSIGAVIAAYAVDSGSAWSQYEKNSALANSNGQFGLTSMMVKTGFVATSLLLQHIALRHNAGLYKRVAWRNIATAGGLAGVSIHNQSLRSRGKKRYAA